MTLAPAPATNWAGNVVFSAQRVHRPGSVEQLQELVASSDRLRVLGTGHSFSAIADTTGDLVLLDALPPVLRVEPTAATVTVSAATRYAELVGPLHDAGFALGNTGSLPHISVAGTCATGTHGSGDTNPVLAASVAALDLVGPDGELRSLRRGDEGFAGSVVALGALGVVTAVTLDVVPAFDVRQTVLEELRSFDDVPEALAAAYSVSLFTHWEGRGFEQVWVKQRADEPPLAPGWLGTTPAEGPRHMVRGEDPAACTEQGGVAGPWHARLPHFRAGFRPSRGDELQSEWFVPRTHAVAALRALDAVRDRIAPVLHVAEVRSIAADDLLLSPASGRDTVALHFTWVADAAAVLPVVRIVEAALEPFDVWAHWGKVTTVPPRHPGLAAFAALRDSVDPEHTFGNALVDGWLAQG